MANYFYYDANGKKQGPFNEQHLQELAAKGTIKPGASLETETGNWVAARQIISQRHFSEQDAPGLLDIRFTRFVTNSCIPCIWVFIIIACLLGWGFCVIIGFRAMNPEISPGGSPQGLGIILAATVVALLSLFVFRMILEATLVLFRIETHLRIMREKSAQ